mmetsp:Transcript_33743/g.78869  ORF Transcript_33743/g.78869 Transcript_33743/m.78869 type:complete len:104 (-) Transcript_33743:12-323(-)
MSKPATTKPPSHVVVLMYQGFDSSSVPEVTAFRAFPTMGRVSSSLSWMLAFIVAHPPLQASFKACSNEQRQRDSRSCGAVVDTTRLRKENSAASYDPLSENVS